MATHKHQTTAQTLTQLLQTNDLSLQKLHDIVAATITEEQLIVHRLTHPQLETRSTAQRIADSVAQFGGSWTFIISFGVILTGWIAFNVLAPNAWQFDQYPFILMNLVLSSIAALQAPIIMMSQNRQEEKDRKRAENDYLINLKAELEIRNLHLKLDLLMEEQITKLMEVQAVQLNMLENLKNKPKNT